MPTPAETWEWGWVLSFVPAGVAAYLGAYLAKKAEHKALREDLDHLTRVAEGIRARVDQKNWIDQQWWARQADRFERASRALNHLYQCYVDDWERIVEGKGQKFDPESGEPLDVEPTAAERQRQAEVKKKWADAEHALVEIVDEGPLVLGDEALNCLRGGLRTPHANSMDEYLDQKLAMLKKAEREFRALALRRLGVDRDEP